MTPDDLCLQTEPTASYMSKSSFHDPAFIQITHESSHGLDLYFEPPDFLYLVCSPPFHGHLLRTYPRSHSNHANRCWPLVRQLHRKEQEHWARTSKMLNEERSLRCFPSSIDDERD